MSVPRVTIEFYGVPRARAGRSELVVTASTVAAALAAAAQVCPALDDLWGADGKISPLYLLSLDGRQFIQNLDQPLEEGDRLLLLSADAGG